MICRAQYTLLRLTKPKDAATPCLDRHWRHADARRCASRCVLLCLARCCLLLWCCGWQPDSANRERFSLVPTMDGNLAMSASDVKSVRKMANRTFLFETASPEDKARCVRKTAYAGCTRSSRDADQCPHLPGQREQRTLLNSRRGAPRSSRNHGARFARRCDSMTSCIARSRGPPYSPAQPALARSALFTCLRSWVDFLREPSNLTFKPIVWAPAGARA